MQVVNNDEVINESVLGNLFGRAQYDVELMIGKALSLADDILLSVSASQILRDLGEYEAFNDVLRLAKYLISEFVMTLSTGCYVNGLATEISELMSKRLRFGSIDEDVLRDFLIELIYLRERIAEGSALCRDVDALVRMMSHVFGIDLRRSRVLKRIVKSCNPGLALQAGLVSLILFVGGIGGVNYVKN